MSSRHPGVVGSSPHQGTYRRQPVCAWMHGAVDWCSLSYFLSVSKINFKFFLKKKRDESNLFDSMCTHQGGAVQGHSKQVTICKPRRKASPEPGHPDTVILDFQPQTCEQINWFRHPVYGILSWKPKPTISKSYWLYLQHTLRIQPISPDSTVTP